MCRGQPFLCCLWSSFPSMTPKRYYQCQVQHAHPQESCRTISRAVYLRMTLNSVLQYIIQRPDMIIRCRICGGQLLRKGCTPAQLRHQTESTRQTCGMDTRLYLLTVHGPGLESVSGRTTLYSCGLSSTLAAVACISIPSCVLGCAFCK